MKTRISITVALLVFFAFAALAQHDHHAQSKPQSKPQNKPQMDPKMMEAMTQAGTPGDAHKKLDGMVGTWTAKVTSRMEPGADSITMEGTSENKWIMGGRYLEQRFSGTFMGTPFDGIGYTGYDNVKKQYWGTWMDSMSTGMMLSGGGMGSDGTWTFTGTFPDPMTGKDQKVDTKMKIVDADHHNFEMWTPAPDGKMFKSMEIAYARKK